MPKFLEKTLQKAAADKGLKGEAADRYTYGTLNSIGAMKGNKETPKGEAMQKKHEKRISPAAAERIAAKVERLTSRR
jgi:hypothetical protein